jgi:hypothetical protein
VEEKIEDGLVEKVDLDKVDKMKIFEQKICDMIKKNARKIQI